MNKEKLKKIWSLSKKEITLFIYSPIVYVVGIFFLVIVGWFFMNSFFLGKVMSMENFFQLLPIIFSFIIPAFTMRSFSEEYSSGSFELLMSLPVNVLDIILGKFLANFIFFGFLILPTIIYPITLSTVGDFYWPSIITSYVGTLLLGSLFISIGIFSSSLTKNQIIAWIIGFAICFFMAMIDSIIFFFPSGVIGLLRYLSIRTHFQGLSEGVLDLRDIIYFLSAIFVFSYTTHMIVTSKKR